jgi:hypothetical protein
MNLILTFACQCQTVGPLALAARADAARVHARAGRTLAAVAATCTSWRAAVDGAALWRALFYARWTVRHAGDGDAALARAVPLPAGAVRCTARDPRGARAAPPRGAAPHTHAWAAMYRARVRAERAVLASARAAAARVRQVLTVGVARRGGVRAATAAVVCDVCTCAAVLPGRRAAAAHLKTHHGLGARGGGGDEG